jgi:hypothetical protein
VGPDETFVDVVTIVSVTVVASGAFAVIGAHDIIAEGHGGTPVVVRGAFVHVFTDEDAIPRKACATWAGPAAGGVDAHRVPVAKGHPLVTLVDVVTLAPVPLEAVVAEAAEIAEFVSTARIFVAVIGVLGAFVDIGAGEAIPRETGSTATLESASGIDTAGQGVALGRAVGAFVQVHTASIDSH